MQTKIILNWLNELADGNPQNYQEYFYDDVRNYVLENNNDSSEKIKNLFKSQNREAVRKWMDDVCGYIAMNIDTECIINEYLQ